MVLLSLGKIHLITGCEVKGEMLFKKKLDLYFDKTKNCSRLTSVTLTTMMVERESHVLCYLVGFYLISKQFVHDTLAAKCCLN